MKRQVPSMTTDEEAEAFLDQDLSDLDFAQFKPVQFRFTEKLTRSLKDSSQSGPTSAPAPTRYLPGALAPRSGVYELRGPRGGHTGRTAEATRGKPLPPTPTGGAWTLVAPLRDRARTPSYEDGGRHGKKDR